MNRTFPPRFVAQGLKAINGGKEKKKSTGYLLLMLLGYAYPTGVANHPISIFTPNTVSGADIVLLNDTLRVSSLLNFFNSVDHVRIELTRLSPCKGNPGTQAHGPKASKSFEMDVFICR